MPRRQRTTLPDADIEDTFGLPSKRQRISSQPETSTSRPPATKRKRAIKRPEQFNASAASGLLIPSSPLMLSNPASCQKCGARKFEFESKKFCCADGEVKIASNHFPPGLLRLLTSEDEDAIHFRTFCRLYNNLFAFSSLAGSVDCKTHKGIYVFRAHGQIYHFLPALLPENEKPKYLQLYFYDSQHEANNRASFFKEIRPDIVALLMEIMRENPYALFFKSLSEQNIDEETAIRINKNVALDQRVFNAPTADEVAAIWSDQSATDLAEGPYIVVTGRSNQSHRIRHYYGCYDPLQYPLLFPHGDNGWHPGNPRFRTEQTYKPTNLIQQTLNQTPDAETLINTEETRSTCHRNVRGKDISCREYYAYLLQIRSNNVLLLTSRLLMQFVVDMYVKLENTRLDFFRNNQKLIRADLYQGVLDTFNAGEVKGSNAGHRVILPPSFIGGPRDMHRRYLNAMSLVQRFGKPDLFATMTCNPNWTEIKNELAPGEKAQNRPDLLARIFHSKLIAMKKEIMEKKIFGEVACMIYVVEFQKRGLPHAHFLIILKTEYKVKAPEDFDRFICAEIPTKEAPYLRQTVLNHMMHGPCGLANPQCACMRIISGRRCCKSRYPKPFTPFTTTNDDGYPNYRRRDTGKVITVRRHPMDNRWVVPYNPYLLALFDCHLNVEICSTIQAVKYLYKYVYKGHDRVSFKVGESQNDSPVDEIERFQSGRWVSPPEACWRLFGFDLYEMYPSVMPLQVHLFNQQNVCFGSNEILNDIISDPRRKKTPLTEFFNLNASRPDGEKYLYSEFPEHFVWHDRARQWRDRKKGSMIGRLTFVAPSEENRFHLRLLLAHVRGPKSFDDLKTVDGHVCASYQEACLLLRLVEASDAIEKCMDEGVSVQMPHALRRLFATVLIFCHPPNPTALWDRYYTALSQDFKRDFPSLERKVFSLTIDKIESLLEGMGKTLAEFGLGHLKNQQDEGLRLTRDVRDAIEAPLPEQYVAARKQLNPEQKTAYKSIIHRVKEGSPGAFFIDGPGGTGKTFLYHAVYAKVRLMNKIVLATASSGIAAAGLPNGRTAHSRFKLPLDIEATLTCNVPKQGSLAELLRQTTLIIWDEAPMSNKANVHSLDLLLRDLCNPDILFGGKVVVFGGDFRQVLPVLPHKTQLEAVDASLVSSPLWPSFSKYKLHTNMRAKEDPVFAAFLLSLGNGELQVAEQSYIPLPDTIEFATVDTTTPVSDLISLFFPEIHQGSPLTGASFCDRALLTTKNAEVDQLNQTIIDSFQGDPVIYKSYDSLINDESSIYPAEFLHTLCPGGMNPHELVLKEDCPVILLRNMDPSSGLCNGTRLICRQFFPNLILCEIATGFYKGETTLLPRINLRPSASSNFPFQFQRRQFPIKLSFAMTINKSQGQTLNEVGIYLQCPCFSHGQLYVALSRARRATKVKVVSSPVVDTSLKNCARNVISFEVLSRAGIRRYGLKYRPTGFCKSIMFWVIFCPTLFIL